MSFSEEDKYVIKILRQNKHYGAKRFLKEFPHKSRSRGGLDIRLFARLIVLELRNVFSAVAIGALLELLTKLKKFKHLLTTRNIYRRHAVLKDKLLGKLVYLVNRIVKKDLCLICMKKT